MNYDRWERELNYFMRNVLNMPRPTKKADWSYASKYSDIRKVLEGIAREVSLILPPMVDISEVRNGIDYEHLFPSGSKMLGGTRT